MEDELSIKNEHLSGALSIKMANGQTLDDFCVAHFTDYNRDRFEAFAMRVYVGQETVITIYAVDKVRQENTTLNLDKIPVKKFKITTLMVNELFSYVEGFNCTITTGVHDIKNMAIINK